MELANFIASYILSVLTLIGLVVAIVFYFQQNRILNEKHKIENFYKLMDWLNTKNFSKLNEELKENTNNLSLNEITDFIYNEIIKATNTRLLYNIMNYMAYQYNNDIINKKFFDFHYAKILYVNWILISNMYDKLKGVGDFIIQVDDYKEFVEKHIALGMSIVECLKNDKLNIVTPSSRA